MRIRHGVMLMILTTGTVACGQKGPLFLPDAHTKAPVPVVTPAAPEGNKDKDKPAAPQKP